MTTATQDLKTQSNLDEWMKLPDFLKSFPQFTHNQMRWLLLHRTTNGLDSCTRKLGKPIYLNVPKFLKWVEGYQVR